MTDTTYESILDHLDPSYWLGVRCSAHLHQILDRVKFGEYLVVTLVNAGGSLSASMSGPALSAQGLSPAVAIDLFDGEPFVVRSDAGALHPALIGATTIPEDTPDWVDLLAERDAALQVMNEHRCGEQAERAYRRTLRAEAERDEARKELAALQVLDGASAERAEAERKALAQQRDEACRERNRYKRDANAARRERNKVRKELARAIAPWTDEEVARPCESGNWGAPSLNERIMRERGFRDE